MKNKNILVVGGLAAIGFYIYNTVKTTLDAIQYEFSKVKILKFDLKKLSLQVAMTLKISNNSDKDLLLQYFKGKMYYGSFFISNVVINQTSLAAGTQKDLVVNFDLPVLSLIGEIQRIIQSGWALYQFNVQGTVIFKLGNLPQQSMKINQNIELAEKFDPSKTL